MKKTKNILGGFLAGAAIGVVTALLLAPSSGRKARNDFMKKSRKLRASINGSVDKLRKNYNEKVDEYASAGKKSIDTIKESIKA